MTNIRLTRRGAFAAAAAIAATPVVRAGAQNMIAPAGANMYIPQGGGGSDASTPMGVLPENGGPNFHPLYGRTFPRAYWAPELYAQTILAEFGASGWAASLTIDKWDESQVDDELHQLLLYADNLRMMRMAEIIAQLYNPLPYWADLLMRTPAAAPATWAVIDTAVAVGQMVAMHFKRRFNRARPAQLYPALMPPAPTPQHPSYPNAHALQGYLIAQCLSGVVPDMVQLLEALAARVGENREIAGFHFPSDTAASKTLAPLVYAKLNVGPLFTALVKEATAEWA